MFWRPNASKQYKDALSASFLQQRRAGHFGQVVPERRPSIVTWVRNHQRHVESNLHLDSLDLFGGLNRFINILELSFLHVSPHALSRFEDFHTCMSQNHQDPAALRWLQVLMTAAHAKAPASTTMTSGLQWNDCVNTHLSQHSNIPKTDAY